MLYGCYAIYVLESMLTENWECLQRTISSWVRCVKVKTECVVGKKKPMDEVQFQMIQNERNSVKVFVFDECRRGKRHCVVTWKMRMELWSKMKGDAHEKI